MNFQPLHDRVLIRSVDAVTTTAGGIIIPETIAEKPAEGEVVAVGRGTRSADGTLIPLQVVIGDKVMYGKWSGTQIRIDGEDLLIMIENDILGILL